MIAKRRVPVLLLSLLLALSGLAHRAGADERPWSLTLDAPLAGKYLWRGINLVDGLVFQPSAAVEYGGFSASVWSSLELCHVNDYGGGYGDGAYDFTEIDLATDYTFDLNRAGLVVGIIHYVFPNTPFQSITEAYFVVGFDVPLSPTLTVYQDVDTIKGTYLHFALSHSMRDLWAISDSVKMSLDVGGAVAAGTGKHNSFYYGVSDFSLADTSLSIDLPFAFGERWSVTPALSFSTLLAGDVRDAVAQPDNVWFGVGVTYAY